MADVDFRRVVEEILACYDINETELAARVGCVQQSINRLRRGAVTQPSYALGDKLVKMWDARPYMKTGADRAKADR